VETGTELFGVDLGKEREQAINRDLDKYIVRYLRTNTAKRERERKRELWVDI